MSDTTDRIPNTPGARHSHSRIPDQGYNYVINGLDMAVIDGALTVSAGSLLVLDEAADEAANEVVVVDVASRYGPSAVPLPSSGTYDIWYDADALEFVVGSDPGGVALKLGLADVDAETTTPANTDPDMRADETTQNSITLRDTTN